MSAASSASFRPRSYISLPRSSMSLPESASASRLFLRLLGDLPPGCFARSRGVEQRNGRADRDSRCEPHYFAAIIFIRHKPSSFHSTAAAAGILRLGCHGRTGKKADELRKMACSSLGERFGSRPRAVGPLAECRGDGHQESPGRPAGIEAMGIKNLLDERHRASGGRFVCRTCRLKSASRATRRKQARELIAEAQNTAAQDTEPEE